MQFLDPNNADLTFYLHPGVCCIASSAQCAQKVWLFRFAADVPVQRFK